MFGTADIEERIKGINKEIERTKESASQGFLSPSQEKKRLEELLALQAELFAQRQKASGAPTGGRGGFGGVRAMVVTPKVEQVQQDPAKAIAKSMEKSAPIIKTYADEINESVAGLVSQTAVVRAQEFKDKLMALDDLLLAGLDPQIYDQAVAGLAGMTSQVGVLKDEMSVFKDESTTAFDDLKYAVEGWGREFTNILTNAAMTGKLSFKDMANSIIGDLIRIQVQKNITDPLVKAGTTFIESAISGISAGGKAIGGAVQAGSAYVVGERGPELFMPSSSGSVVPNNRMGGNVSVNIVNNSGVQATASESTDSRGQRRIDVVIGELAGSEMRRGGSSINMALRQTFGVAPTLAGR
jgi:hypothetical protein